MTETTNNTLVERLAEHPLVGSMPRAELEWLARNGTMQVHEAGLLYARKGDPLSEMVVILTGRFVTLLELASGRTTLLETRAGDVSGALPYSRAAGVVGDVRIEERMESLSIPVERFPEMTRECPQLVARLVHRMIDRAKVHSSARLQDERLKSLGRLAAGLAHELDNPASAALGSVRSLREALAESAAAAAGLESARLSSEQLEALSVAMSAARESRTWSALDRADRHDALVDWLDSHNADAAMADTLVDCAVGSDDLDRLARVADGDKLACMVRAVAAERNVTSLAAGIESSVARIHQLVSSVRRFTNLGRAPGAEATDIAQGLRDVVDVHNAKAQAKSVTITLTLPDELPPVNAGADLSQAWADLLDNAIDAVGDNGEVEVRASAEEGEVVVRVIDNGPGIAAEVQARMFEPFYTTKPQGQGLGLGLDTVRRIVLANAGRISADSRPGRTEFRVSLPVAG